ncbi:hypothetical protein [Saccharicrinis aurantiacus]|uniref:hypothetical protein n=1 Tax=Saccharicrinis aurantiacus TaxID=1849719 RepID=UPI002491C064|nr:hypothetical protein [Saccharicrinis aurantiacus]
MKKMSFLTILAASVLAFSACNDDEGTPDSIIKNRDLTITNKVVSTEFVGNGAQWGGYDVVPTWFDGQTTLSEADWQKLFHRIDYMRPPFIRVCVSSGWAYEQNDNPADYKDEKVTSLYKMLDYAQEKNIEIVYGEWGHEYVGDDIASIDMDWMQRSVIFLNHLVNDKGYSCIKSVNIVNEPNGNWSSTNGNYEVWKAVQEAYLVEMAKPEYNLADMKLSGPDIAAFNDATLKDWITDAAADLNDDIVMYDIHVYPSQSNVRNGGFTDMLLGYKAEVPEGKRIFLGEIGFKYDATKEDGAVVDDVLNNENIDAIAADPYAGDDSNMMIYKAFYGIDMADAIIQSMRAGFSGALIWGMDDAMYNSPDGDNPDWNTKKLKRWGFWNILGEELCGTPEDEEIRPYFYTSSLLCRYFPAGSTIYDIELPNKKGVRAIMGEKDGKYTVAIVNSHYVTYPINLKSDFLSSLTMDKYTYKSNADGTFVGVVDENGFAAPAEKAMSVDFKSGVQMTLEGESFILYTNME